METKPVIERAIPHHRETGKFLVFYDQERYEFESLLAAFLFYDRIENAASLWDMTADIELLEKKVCVKQDLLRLLNCS